MLMSIDIDLEKANAAALTLKTEQFTVSLTENCTVIISKRFISLKRGNWIINKIKMEIPFKDMI